MSNELNSAVIDHLLAIKLESGGKALDKAATHLLLGVAAVLAHERGHERLEKVLAMIEVANDPDVDVIEHQVVH